MTEITTTNDKFQTDEWLDDDSVLKLVRETRLGILKTQMASGILPQDKDGFDQVHNNLKELSKDATKGKQLQQEAKSSEEQAKLAMAIANSLAKNMGGDPFQNRTNPIDIPDEVIPQPTQLIGTANVAPGELIIGDDTTSYAVFNETVGKAMDEARRGVTDDEE